MNSAEKCAVNFQELDTRAAVYKLLADCYQSPDENIFERFYSLKEMIGELYPEISCSNAITNNDYKELKVDHARLFVGPFSLLAPPYGSIYLEHSDHLMTASTANVQQWYKAEGMEVAIHEIPDHIRIELEFMYFLIYRENFKWVNLNKETYKTEINSYRHKQKLFLEQHLSKWMPQFEKKIKEHAQTQFYRQLAEITRQFIHRDLLFMKEANKNLH